MKTHKQYISRSEPDGSCQLTGMKQPQIARLESGAYLPQIGTLRKLLGVLGGKLELGANVCRLTATHRKAVAR